MVETVKSTYDFIKGALPIRVGVLASDDAEEICLKNNLTFTDLVKPFSTLTNESQIQGPGSQSYRVYNLHVHTLDVKNPVSESSAASSSKESMAAQISEFAGNENIPTVKRRIARRAGLSRACVDASQCGSGRPGFAGRPG